MERQFRAGEALGRGLSIWAKNLPAFLVLAILVYAPVIVYTAVVASDTLIGDTEQIRTYTIVTWLLKFPLGLIVTAAVLYGTFQQLRGEHAGIAASIGFGLKRLFPVLGVGILTGILTYGWFVLAFIPGVGRALFLPALVGFLAVFCRLYVSVPVAVVERAGLIGSLRRSSQLTEHNKLSIFGVALVVFALAIVASLAIQSMFDEDAMTDHQLKVLIWLSLAVDIALAALNATINGVVYHDLRRAKEGVDTEELSRVFE
jgi:hypothetical protein